MKTYTAKEWLKSECGLGESPLYRPPDDTFFFVDIKNKLVHAIPRATESGARDTAWSRRRTYAFDECVTRLHVVAGRVDVLAVQTKLGFALLDLELIKVVLSTPLSISPSFALHCSTRCLFATCMSCQ